MMRIRKYINFFIKLSIALIAWAWVILIIEFGISLGSIITIKYSYKFMIPAIVVIVIDYLFTRKLPPEAIELNQKREIQIKGNFEKIFDQCMSIMKKWKSIKSVTQIQEKMEISARTKISIFTMGEEISLQFEILNEHLIKINIKSKPVGRFTLLDFGKNYRNVEWIKEKIESTSSKK